MSQFVHSAVAGDIKELAAADIEDGHVAGVVMNCNWVASKFRVGMVGCMNLTWFPLMSQVFPTCSVSVL